MIKYQPKTTSILVAMAYKGLTQSSLGAQAELDSSSISLFLNGKRNISPTSAKKIAEALDKDIKDLFKVEVKREEVNI